MATQQEWEDAFDVSTPESVEDLMILIQDIIDGPDGGHDYNTSGVSMSIAARHAFNFVARELGASGFQAGYAALHAYKALMRIEGPFGIVKADDMLYPQQGSPVKKATDYEVAWADWARDRARELLAENEPDRVHPDVWAHWEALASE